MSDDIRADHQPRSKFERESSDAELRARVEVVLNDWNDDNWLQFSMWHLHQIKAYLARTLAEGAP